MGHVEASRDMVRPKLDALLRNLDEAVVERLKARARSEGRSLQAELMWILEQAAQSARSGRSVYRDLADEVPATLAGRPQTDRAVLLDEDRRRWTDETLFNAARGDLMEPFVGGVGDDFRAVGA